MPGVTTAYQTGVHGSRPANGAGCVLYSCTTHSLVYRDDGSTWTTFMTLGTSGALTDPMTTRGDIIVRNSSNATARLAAGAAGKILSSDGTDVSWGNGPMTTAGDIIIGGASGLPTRLAAGATSGHVLTSNGSAAAPSYQAAPGGGSGALVFLEAHTASASSSLDFTTFISSTYDTYVIHGVELVLATSTADLRIEIGTGVGPTYDTGNTYEWARVGFTTGGSGNNDSGSTGIARIFKSMSVTAAYGFGTFSITATGLQSTALRKTLHGTIEYVDSTPTAIYGMWGMQWTTSGTAATALRFIPSSGNITSGTIRIYGVTKS